MALMVVAGAALSEATEITIGSVLLVATIIALAVKAIGSSQAWVDRRAKQASGGRIDALAETVEGIARQVGTNGGKTVQGQLGLLSERLGGLESTVRNIAARQSPAYLTAVLAGQILPTPAEAEGMTVAELVRAIEVRGGELATAAIREGGSPCG